ncbi:MAG: VPLPA-CTERM sorting domain-containing protein [Defluviimonas sp.]|nr:VPLPA-CTERM sorting domain-containing protein [Defluviimonas sp.]
MFGVGTTGDFSVTYEAATVPLPAAAPLLLAALGGLGFAARRKKKAA